MTIPVPSVAVVGEPTVTAERYSCPMGDHLWVRTTAVAGVPSCPTHGTPLARDVDVVVEMPQV